ncbi:hypothetical protein AB0F77_16620 [Streptomyces sp. NPDC026672]|uniref:hypothetical protein n=1 Tax=unclassified Streptomyces TaxID=2593676 RepID=UPI0033CE4C4D
MMQFTANSLLIGIGKRRRKPNHVLVFGMMAELPSVLKPSLEYIDRLAGPLKKQGRLHRPFGRTIVTAEFGLSWISMQCDCMEQTLTVPELDCLVETGSKEALLLVAERSVTAIPAPGHTLLGQDVRRLLDSPLDDSVLRTVWVGGAGFAFDPKADKESLRDWLAGVETSWLNAERRTDPGFTPPPPAPSTDPALREAVLEAIDRVAPGLTAAADKGISAVPLVGMVPALTDVVERANADLGFRLFLRVLKAYCLPISPPDHHALLTLGERFGYRDLVDEGELNLTPSA